MRTCKKCNIEKELTCFYKRKQSYQYNCKDCQNEVVKNWRVGNKENYAVYERDRKLKSLYGFMLEVLCINDKCLFGINSAYKSFFNMHLFFMLIPIYNKIK